MADSARKSASSFSPEFCRFAPGFRRMQKGGLSFINKLRIDKWQTALASFIQPGG
jgi:hypothetical protein